jgi:hypothetical protein
MNMYIPRDSFVNNQFLHCDEEPNMGIVFGFLEEIKEQEEGSRKMSSRFNNGGGSKKDVQRNAAEVLKYRYCSMRYPLCLPALSTTY